MLTRLYGTSLFRFSQRAYHSGSSGSSSGSSAGTADGLGFATALIAAFSGLAICNLNDRKISHQPGATIRGNPKFLMTGQNDSQFLTTSQNYPPS